MALSQTESLDEVTQRLRACRVCRDLPEPKKLPHEPRPIFRISETAKLFICSQAPGMRAHTSGIPFDDPSGVRLRAWMGVTVEEFYDCSKIGIIPMGFCFPGYDKNKGDLPPRKECALLWRQRLFDALPQKPSLILLVGSYSQNWHLGKSVASSLTQTLRGWQTNAPTANTPRYLPLPHPSWRNNGWLKRNPWFETDILPYLRREVHTLIRE